MLLFAPVFHELLHSCVCVPFGAELVIDIFSMKTVTLMTENEAMKAVSVNQNSKDAGRKTKTKS